MKKIFSTGTLSKRATLSLMIVSIFACGRSANQGAANQVKEYAVIQVQPESSELYNSYPASINGQQDVEIRPKVSGFITKLCVDEGVIVRKGQALFLIDRVQYETAVKSAEATVKVAEANIATSKSTVATKTELAAKNIISQYELETAQNDLLSKEAVLAQAKAQLENARNDLSFTTITSPSDGIVGTIPFRIGSLVGPSTSTPLTTVSDISKMHVYFSVNEKQLLSLIREGGTMEEILNRMPEVQLRLADGSMYPGMGKIETIGGVVNTTLGSTMIRATFVNDKNILRSGSSGNIVIPNNLDSVIIIPQKATYEIQNKKFVYTVTDSATVNSTEIQVLPTSDGKTYVVTSGLNNGDKIVVEGINSLRNGTKIKTITPEESAAKTSAMTQQGVSGK